MYDIIKSGAEWQEREEKREKKRDAVIKQEFSFIFAAAKCRWPSAESDSLSGELAGNELIAACASVSVCACVMRLVLERRRAQVFVEPTGGKKRAVQGLDKKRKSKEG